MKESWLERKEIVIEGGVGGGMKYKLEMNCEAETEKQKMFEKILQKYILRSMCVHNNRNPF